MGKDDSATEDFPRMGIHQVVGQADCQNDAPDAESLKSKEAGAHGSFGFSTPLLK